MGYFTLRILLLAALAAGAAIAIPWGALLAARRSRARHSAIPGDSGHTGAQTAGLLLHRERLGAITIGTESAPLKEVYDPHAGHLRMSEETARSRSAYAVATAAFLVAQATLHADRDRDFESAHRRAPALYLAVNLLPPALLLAILVPGEARALGLVAAPVLLALAGSCALLDLSAARLTSRRALALLDRHGLSGSGSAREAIQKALTARAALALATPLTRCFWFQPAL